MAAALAAIAPSRGGARWRGILDLPSSDPGFLNSHPILPFSATYVHFCLVEPILQYCSHVTSETFFFPAIHQTSTSFLFDKKLAKFSNETLRH